MHVAKQLCSFEAAEFLDEHLTVPLVAPLARLDDQSMRSAVEKRVDHATEALGPDCLRLPTTASRICRRRLSRSVTKCHRRCPGRQNDRTSRRSPSTSPSATTATHTW